MSPDWFRRWCPPRNIFADWPPTLRLHGTADIEVPYERSLEMADALSRAGVENRRLALPGCGHGIDRAVTCACLRARQRSPEADACLSAIERIDQHPHGRQGRRVRLRRGSPLTGS